MSTKVIRERFKILLEEYATNIKLELRELWNDLDIDFSKKEQYEVIGGIMARQITLTTHLMSSSSLWTGDIAPLILRCLTDNYINLAWILKSPLERSQKFILYGLGQEKLMMEHRKKQMESEGLNPEEDDLIKFSEAWINSQRYTFLTEVDVGSWSGLSTREMAQQSDCIDFYNYVYQPFSFAAHNMWNHIAKYNLKVSENILHRFLKFPVISDIEPHFDYFELAAKYTDKCFNLYYRTFSEKIRKTFSYKILLDRLKNLDLSTYEGGG